MKKRIITILFSIIGITGVVCNSNLVSAADQTVDTIFSKECPFDAHLVTSEYCDLDNNGVEEGYYYLVHNNTHKLWAINETGVQELWSTDSAMEKMEWCFQKVISQGILSCYFHSASENEAHTFLFKKSGNNYEFQIVDQNQISDGNYGEVIKERRGTFLLNGTVDESELAALPSSGSSPGAYVPVVVTDSFSEQAACVQEYNGKTYAAFRLEQMNEAGFWEDKVNLDFAAGSRFVCYGNKVYYTELAGNSWMVNAPLYAANLDGSGNELIDDWCDCGSIIAAEDGKIFYGRKEDLMATTEVYCCYPEIGKIELVAEGTIKGSINGAVYVSGQSGVMRIKADNTADSKVILPAGGSVHVGENLVAVMEEIDYSGNFRYSVYDTATEAVNTIAIANCGYGTECAIGDYLLSYTNGIVSQYALADGSLVSKISVASAEAFRYGNTIGDEKPYAAIFQDNTCRVFLKEEGRWSDAFSLSQVSRALYEWLNANCVANEYGQPLPQSVEAVSSMYAGRPIDVFYVDEEAICLGYRLTDYQRNDPANPIFCNQFFVMIYPDGRAVGAGASYLQ